MNTRFSSFPPTAAFQLSSVLNSRPFFPANETLFILMLFYFLHFLVESSRSMSEDSLLCHLIVVASLYFQLPGDLWASSFLIVAFQTPRFQLRLFTALIMLPKSHEWTIISLRHVIGLHNVSTFSFTPPPPPLRDRDQP